MTKWDPTILALALWFFPLPAWAADDPPEEVVVVPPVVSAMDLSINPKDLHRALIAELMRGPEFDLVTPTAGSQSWNPACLEDVRCLEELAITGGAPHLVAAAVAPSPDGPIFDIVHVYRGLVQERVAVPVPERPADIEERVFLAVESLLTGIPIPPELLGLEPPTAEPEPPAVERGLKPEKTKKDPPKAAPEPEAPAVAKAEKPEKPKKTVKADKPEKANQPEKTAKASKANKPEKTAKSSRTVQAKEAKERPTDRVGWRLVGRGGWARYDKFDFASGGIEGARRLVGPLFLVAGIELYAVNRELPPNLQLADGGTRVWNAMAPLSAGLQFQTLKGVIRPYVGGEAVVAQYHRDEDGMYWATGGRGRIGVDLQASPTVGWNLHGGLGFWSDEEWVRVEPDIATSGLVFQLGTGLVITR
ncbi:MAG: hypothetical protein AAGA48_27215 [Myxococcota bacterium]